MRMLAAAGTLTLVCLLFPGLSTRAHGASVAVFPLDDLTNEESGVTISLGALLIDGLARAGVDTTPEDAVLSFMASHRIRHLGYLTTNEILAAGRELGVGYVLIGSVCQLRTDVPAAGLTLSLYDAGDARLAWSNVAGVSRMDESRALGIAEPRTMDELLPVLRDTVFATWPALFDDRAGGVDGQRSEGKGKEKSGWGQAGIDSVLLAPRYARPDETVRCIVRLRETVRAENGPGVTVRVGDRTFPAVRREGIYYEATWSGLLGAGRKPVQVAMLDTAAEAYLTMPGGVEAEVSYPVVLVLDWPDGTRDESFIGSYRVDTRGPVFSLEPMGHRLGGTVAFRDRVAVLVRWEERERTARWECLVKDAAGRIVFREKGLGMVPDRLVWRGQDLENARADEGLYSFVLRAWDLAGNESEASVDILYRTNPPDITLKTRLEGDGVSLDLAAGSDMPLRFWRLELWGEDGSLIQVTEGERLPASVRLGMGTERKEVPNGTKGTYGTYENNENNEKSGKISVVLMARDILGGSMKRRLASLSIDADTQAPGGPIDDLKPAGAGWDRNF